MTDTIVLTGDALTTADVAAVARAFAPVALSEGSSSRLADSRRVVEAAAAGKDPVYGINTGFGKLASVKIPADQLLELQRNLIVSHASGMGDPLPADEVRAAMLLRLNVLLKPTSGVRPVLAETLAAMLNAGIHPVVPALGSVGASGDLAPLSHLAMGVMGEGEVDVVDVGADGRRAVERCPAGSALRRAGIVPVAFQAKEGLAFVNGTQVQTAHLALLLEDAARLWRNAHGAAAMSLEALRGSPAAFDERLHRARPHPGQVASAALLRDLLAGSEIRESHRLNDERVQDPYCLRCTPQILGPVQDTIDYGRAVAAVEMNSATDNPLVFGDDLLSGGNFHGQPVAMAMDYLAIAVATLAGLAERRLERIVNPDLSGGLPAFLAARPGVESGLMMVQIAAAALVGECRTSSGPASIHSIPTDANQEDYVPMSMAAAAKARRVVDAARRVVACEFLCASQGIGFHRPLRSSPAVEALFEKIRAIVPPVDHDRSLTADLERIAEMLAKEDLV